MPVRRKDIRGAILLFIICTAMALIFNQLSPHGIALVGQWDKSTGNVVNAVAKDRVIDSGIEINHPVKARRIVLEKKRVVLDARISQDYEKGHLPGAISFPLADFDENLPEFLKKYSRSTPILAYCSSIECMDSHTLAERLSQLKYTDIKVFSGGYRLWLEMGYEIEK